MIDVFEFSVFAVVAFLFFILSYVFARSIFVSKKMSVAFLESEAKVEALTKKINNIAQGKEELNIEKSKAFMGFISESRDQAFVYIEGVQASIYKLKLAREALNVESWQDLDDTALEILRNAVDEVLSHLPEDSQDS